MNFTQATLLAGLDHYQDPNTQGLVPNIQPGVTFSTTENSSALLYARSSNDNATLIESIICKLESGVESKVFNSGASAAYAVLSTIRPHDTLVMQEDSYYEFQKIIAAYCKKIHANFMSLDFSTPEGLQQLEHVKNVKLVWAETVSNPFWNTVDLENLADTAHRIGAKLLVDATISTPLNCRPLLLGCDYVLHSATKYLNGHGDVIAGVITTSKIDDTWNEIIEFRTNAGCILQSFEGWLLLRGLRTLDLRIQRAFDNADQIVAWLKQQDCIEHIYYLGLSDKKYLSKQFKRPSSAMISFLHKGDQFSSRAMCNATQVFRNATSLGSTESLIEFRRETEGQNSLCPDNLIRLSIGLESVQDLILDLEHVFQQHLSTV